MKQFIIAYIDGYDGSLTQTLFIDSSARAALLRFLAEKQDITFSETDLLRMEDVGSIIDYVKDYGPSISIYALE